jgi:hypothetical protein
VLGVLLSAVCVAVLRLLAQVTVAVSAPATLAAGDPALVRVEVTAPAGASVRLTPPDVAPFTVASADRVPTAGGLNAPGWRRYEWRYVLAPPAGARGRYAFEPFAAFAQGPGLRPVTATSRAWALDVRAPAPPLASRGAPVAPPVAGAGAAARNGGVSFSARLTPARVYVGQQATYELTVSVDAAARGRIRRNPEFVPPELRGVLAVELPATHESTPAGDVHVYRRAVFPLAPWRGARARRAAHVLPRVGRELLQPRGAAGAPLQPRAARCRRAARGGPAVGVGRRRRRAPRERAHERTLGARRRRRRVHAPAGGYRQPRAAAAPAPAGAVGGPRGGGRARHRRLDRRRGARGEGVRVAAHAALAGSVRDAGRRLRGVRSGAGAVRHARGAAGRTRRRDRGRGRRPPG